MKRLFDNKGNFTVDLRLKGANISSPKEDAGKGSKEGEETSNLDEREIQESSGKNEISNQAAENRRDSPMDLFGQYYIEIIFLVITLTEFIAFIVYMIKKLF